MNTKKTHLIKKSDMLEQIHDARLYHAEYNKNALRNGYIAIYFSIRLHLSSELPNVTKLDIRERSGNNLGDEIFIYLLNMLDIVIIEQLDANNGEWWDYVEKNANTHAINENFDWKIKFF